MASYRVNVRIELINEDYGDKLVTYDSHTHWFEANQANGSHDDYRVIDDAVFEAIQRLGEKR